MQILQVIPITKSLDTEVLSYFSAKEITLGTLVTVPLRKKEIKAIVVQSESVVNMKAQLRGANYQIRNITAVHKNQVFSPEFLMMCERIKNFYVSTTGRIISQISPSFILKNLEAWSRPQEAKLFEKSSSFRELLIQQGRADRVTYYKTLIREHLSKKESLHIVCPTVNEVTTLGNILQKNNDCLYMLHGNLTKKQADEVYNELLHRETPSIIVSTPGFIDTYQIKKTTIVIEHESSPHYNNISAPYIDMRIVIKEYAYLSNITLLWADSILRPETYDKYNDQEAELVEPFNKRIFKNDIVLVEQNAPIKEKQTDAERIAELSNKDYGFKILHPNIEKEIKKRILLKERIFLFVHKKSLAPTIVCNTCGNVARSPESGLPYSLYIRTNKNTRIKERLFICNMTGESIPAFDICQFCNNWNLVSMGIGTEGVQDEIKKLFPKTQNYIIDSEHTKTKKALKEVVDTYEKTNKAIIIIGTEKALPHIHNTDLSVVVSLDAYFSKMSYNIHSRVLDIISTLSEDSKNPLILQSRNITTKSLPILGNGLYSPYIETELSERKKFHYPPYSTICIVKRKIPQHAIKKEFQFLTENFKSYQPHIMSYPSHKKGLVQLIMMIQLDIKEWSTKKQNQPLWLLLSSFDRYTDIQFNPQNLI